MKRLVLVALFSIYALSQSQQSSMVSGHIGRGLASTAAGIPVVARSVAGVPVALVRTDSTGGYRLNIPPGQYYVSAGLVDAPTLYPGVGDVLDAKTVHVVAGSNVMGIDFSLVNPVDIQVSGRVVIDGGGALPLDVAALIGSALPPGQSPNSPALMRMIAQSTLGGVRASTTVKADGTFSMALPLGDNQIVVQALPLGYYVQSIFARNLNILQNPFTVAEGNLPEIVVTLTRTAPSADPPTVTVRGRITGVPSDTNPRWAVLQSATTGPAVFGVPSTIAEVPIQADGSFEVRGVAPGNYTLSPIQLGSPPSARVTLPVPAEGVSVFEMAWAAPRPARSAPSPASAPPPVLVTLRGKVEIVPGATMPSSVRLSPFPQRGSSSREVPVNGDGTFEFANVPRGRLEVRIGRDALGVIRHFTIGIQSVTNLEMKAPVEVHGRVVMVDGGGLPPATFQIQTEFEAEPGAPLPFHALPTIQREFDMRDDGSFTLGLVRGEQRISVLGLPATYFVKSIQYGATDLLANALTLDALPAADILVTLAPTGAPPPTFRFMYQYGHNTLLQANAVDSARGTYTKDMVEDPPRIFNLRLTQSDVDQVEKKLIDIDFWNSAKYPPVFTMPNPGQMGCSSTGRQPIYLFVARGETTKELTWMDQDSVCGTPNQAGADLRSLMNLIRGIIEAKPEYQKLPRALGSYID